MNENELLKLMKKFLSENQQTYIAYSPLKELSGLGDKELSQIIGVLKSKHKLGEKKIGSARTYFPLTMLDMYVNSEKL